MFQLDFSGVCLWRSPSSGNKGPQQHVDVGQNEWYHVGVGAPPILEPILAGIGGYLFFTHSNMSLHPCKMHVDCIKLNTSEAEPGVLDLVVGVSYLRGPPSKKQNRSKDKHATVAWTPGGFPSNHPQKSPPPPKKKTHLGLTYGAWFQPPDWDLCPHGGARRLGPAPVM